MPIGLRKVSTTFVLTERQRRQPLRPNQGAQIKGAIDSHIKDNRDARKQLQERRNVLAKQMEELGKAAENGQAIANSLCQNVESQLALAKHAETWEWKEAQSPKEN